MPSANPAPNIGGTVYAVGAPCNAHATPRETQQADGKTIKKRIERDCGSMNSLIVDLIAVAPLEITSFAAGRAGHLTGSKGPCSPE